MKKTTSDKLIDRLKQLDADATVRSHQSVDLVRLVVAKRRRYQVTGRATRYARVAIAVSCVAICLSIPLWRLPEDGVRENPKNQTASRNVDHIVDFGNVSQIEQKLRKLREQSAQVQRIVEQLDEVSDQHKILDRFIWDLERQSLEDSIRTELSGSLTISASYDFGY